MSLSLSLSYGFRVMSGFDRSSSMLQDVLTWNSRPGILVLINEADWELEGEDHYELKEGDNVLFVSTLHGG